MSSTHLGFDVARLADVRLVALDLDGTTLTTDKRLTERTAAAIRGVRATGREVVFATGRMLATTVRYAQRLGLAGPHVVLNGSLVADALDAEPLFASPVPSDVVRRSLDAAAGMRRFWLKQAEVVTTDDGAEPFEAIRTWTEELGERALPTLTDESPEGVLQLHWVGERDELQGVADALSADDPRLCAVLFPSARASHHHLEIVSVGCNKASGLAQIQARLGVSVEETLTVGDWLNDMELLRDAGFGVAMGNATPELKAVARAVLPATNDEDGLAQLLEAAFL
jgi:Cof subfamily protein (haloacid dehalogenase superfamily)